MSNLWYCSLHYNSQQPFISQFSKVYFIRSLELKAFNLLFDEYCFLLQVIAAEGEQKASRALREAADVISQSPSALQVRAHSNNRCNFSAPPPPCYVLSS